MQSRRSRRGLSTARAALQVEWLLAARPDGVRADQVAETLGKSMSTAYNLLASLCEEGVAAHHPGGVYRITPAFRELVATGSSDNAPELHDLSGLVVDLLARTHKRSYLAVVRGGEIYVVLERGLQGMPKLPGFSPRIIDNAHAVALGKVVLALARPEVVARYVRRPGLRRFTDHTIVDPVALREELADVRRQGVAIEREEFDDDFCCIAAPVRDAHRRFLGVIGISMTRRAFDDERDTLSRTLIQVANAFAAGDFQAFAETGPDLDRAAERDLACVSGSSVP